MTEVADVDRVPDVVTELLLDELSMERFAVPFCPEVSGAVVTFVGAVRNHDDGRGVLELEYVTHPSASRVLQETAEAVAMRHPEVVSARVGHRVGLMAVGGWAFYVEVTSPHRADAFSACSDLVDDVKRLLPVWKRQVFTDGTEAWVNSP